MPRSILYCHCAYAQVVPAETKSAVLDGLSASGVSFEAVPDLCEMSARRDPALAQLASSNDATIVACYPRAVRWLFNAAGVPLPEEVRVLNMRVADPATVLADLPLDTEAKP
ncbi:hypothetical protein BH24ACI4_BH24ACI4_22250 [soil metagenome]